jgi:hypothetical protein
MVDVGVADVNVGNGIEVGVVDVVFVVDDCKAGSGSVARIGGTLAAGWVSHMCASRVSSLSPAGLGFRLLVCASSSACTLSALT